MPARPALSKRPSEEGRKQPVRVVIADDDAAVLEQIARLLETRFEVAARVANGRELIEAIRTFHPEVVVADVTMPEMNGIEAARQISKRFSATKVIMLSGHSDPMLIEGSFAAGASGYVIKLQVFTDLIPAIEVALSGRQYRPVDDSIPPARLKRGSE